jgi:hypothetical protein
LAPLLLAAALVLGQGEPAEPVQAGPTVDLLMDVGVGFPFGTLAPGVALATFVSTNLNATFTGVWYVHPRLGVGAYLRVTGADLESGWGRWCGGCTAVDGGLGALVRWSFPTGGPVEPWVAGFAGWERLFDEDAGTFHYDGLEMGAAAGIDYHPPFPVGIGAYLGARGGAFLGAYARPPFPQVTAPAWHGWLDVGIRFILTF